MATIARHHIAAHGPKVVIPQSQTPDRHGQEAGRPGIVAARRFGAARLVDPRPAAVGSIRDVLERYPALEPLVPAMGYGPAQIGELEATLNAVNADLVLSATPIDITRPVTLNKPITRVRYELAPVGGMSLSDVIEPIVRMTQTPALAVV